MVKSKGCKGDVYCPGLQSMLGQVRYGTHIRAALIVDMLTRKEYHVVQFGKMGRKDEKIVLNWCPFCGNRLNKAYYDHCKKRG